jgi:hypothetical protein
MIRPYVIEVFARIHIAFRAKAISNVSVFIGLSPGEQFWRSWRIALGQKSGLASRRLFSRSFL